VKEEDSFNFKKKEKESITFIIRRRGKDRTKKKEGKFYLSNRGGEKKGKASPSCR